MEKEKKGENMYWFATCMKGGGGGGYYPSATHRIHDKLSPFNSFEGVFKGQDLHFIF